MPDPPAPASAEPLRRLSIVIPARNEEGSVGSTVNHLHELLTNEQIEHQIVVVDDGSSDGTWALLQELQASIPELHPVQNDGRNGFGRAISFGLDRIDGDAVVVMMADESDAPEDVILYWRKLQEGYDCVFGSRFVSGGGVNDYPWTKLVLNRFANRVIQVLFGIDLNDTTNAFKAYRAKVIAGLKPIISPHFNLTIELPLKAIVRGYSWTVLPITWSNRKSGVAKWKIREMGSRYLFTMLHVWLEWCLTGADYKSDTSSRAEVDPPRRLSMTLVLAALACLMLTGWRAQSVLRAEGQLPGPLVKGEQRWLVASWQPEAPRSAAKASWLFRAMYGGATASQKADPEAFLHRARLLTLCILGASFVGFLALASLVWHDRGTDLAAARIAWSVIALAGPWLGYDALAAGPTIAAFLLKLLALICAWQALFRGRTAWAVGAVLFLTGAWLMDGSVSVAIGLLIWLALRGRPVLASALLVAGTGLMAATVLYGSVPLPTLAVDLQGALTHLARIAAYAPMIWLGLFAFAIGPDEDNQAGLLSVLFGCSLASCLLKSLLLSDASRSDLLLPSAIAVLHVVRVSRGPAIAALRGACSVQLIAALLVFAFMTPQHDRQAQAEARAVRDAVLGCRRPVLILDPQLDVPWVGPDAPSPPDATPADFPTVVTPLGATVEGARNRRQVGNHHTIWKHR